MKLHKTSRPRAFIQAIDILRDERKVIKDTAPMGKDIVGAIRLRSGNALTAPVVPLPYQHGVSRKRVGCRELFRTKHSPEPLGASKRLDSARGGDTGPSQHCYALTLGQSRCQVGDA